MHKVPTCLVLLDLENLVMSSNREFDFGATLEAITQSLPKDTRITSIRGYADWAKMKDYRNLSAYGMQPIQIPATNKNSGDILMVIDAIELFYTSNYDILWIVTGDSDFVPLVHRLRQNHVLVYGMGVRDNTSHTLSTSCDSFLFIDDIEDTKSDKPGGKYASVLYNKNFFYVPHDFRRRATDAICDLIWANATASTKQEPLTINYLIRTATHNMRLGNPEDQAKFKSCLYHLFYSFFFEIDRTSKEKELWDKPITGVDVPIDTVKDLESYRIAVFWYVNRKILATLRRSVSGEIQPEEVNKWFYDGDKTHMTQKLLESLESSAK